jgi:hypothetical protein
MMRQVVLGASLGECIHIAGLLDFLQPAEKAGFGTAFLRPAIPVDKLIEKSGRGSQKLWHSATGTRGLSETFN